MKAIGAILALCLVLAGCGYQPLYGDRANAVTSEDLGLVYIAPVSDRSGQQLRNFLLEDINANGQPSRPIYTLTISLSVVSTGVSLSRDSTTSRTSITATAKYSLSETASGKKLFSSTSRGTDAYDVLVSDYGTLASQDDATKRALREVSSDMRTQIAVYFRGRKEKERSAR
jgi:LPS-assembly lipoprotein